MADSGARLLVTEKLEPDESLVGCVLSLTGKNVYETPSVMLGLAGLDRSTPHNCQFIFGN